ncbi:quinate permease [Exophiala aquamarina CBS 119918]|uniref:Quinate transporter n=1 Tax=Exophiala aquamarina CBS 119918 TaxID=1182545 RepID=A0A072PP81_9EURO|nr:quinate permease [Exophiala aquamarina CBS 119918]KEF57280.1 quinate permease [Exophiala aquamarina CBS 119918]
MGLLTLVEDRPTPKSVYNWRVYFSAAVAGSAAIMIGYDSAFIGGTLALPAFKEEFDFASLSTTKVNLLTANIVSCYQAGAFFGAFFAYAAGHYLGRRLGLMFAAGVFTLGAGLMLGANGDRGLGLIYGGRVLAGLGVGMASNLSPIFCAEIAPPAIRGRLVGLYEMAWQIGGLVGFWINYGVAETMAPSHRQWIIPFALQLVPAGLLFAGAFVIKESPRWLFSKGRREEGLKNLCWLRQLPAEHIYMQEEVFAIDNAIEDQRATVGLGFWQPFRAVINDRKTTYRFLLGGSLFLWQNATGINAINYYSPTVFKSIGITGTNTSLLTTGIFGVIKTVITIIWLLFLIDKLGRRFLLIWGAIAGSLCMWYIGGYIAVAKPANNPTGSLSSGGVSAMVFFYLWTATYTPSWNGTPWVLNSEMFSQNVRTLAQAFAAANNWFWNFIIARFTPQMFATMGYGVYFFFASLMLCAAVFVFFLVPETKGVPLEAMDRLFSKEYPARHAHKQVLATLRIEEQDFRRHSMDYTEKANIAVQGDHHVEKV